MTSMFVKVMNVVKLECFPGDWKLGLIYGHRKTEKYICITMRILIAAFH